MALCPFANLEHLITIDTAERSHTPVRLTLHTAWPGPRKGPLYPHGRPMSNGTYAHFYIDSEGTLYQHRDTALAARADGKGNFGSISVETWDGAREQALNTAQLETFKRLWEWVLATHPTVPNQLAKPGDLRGMAWHRLGVEGNFGAYNPNDPCTWSRAQTGAVWSTARGKTCPTNPKIRQAVAVQAGTVHAPQARPELPEGHKPLPTDATPPRPRAIPPQNFTARPTGNGWTRFARQGRAQYYGPDMLIGDGVWGTELTKSIQTWLRHRGYYTTAYLIDGDFGAATAIALQRWLRDAGHYGTEYVIDGVFGTHSLIGLQLALRADGLYPAGEYTLDGVCGNYMLTDLQRWMAGDY
ncbi:N-acetylmuramoyl-L-alanine amidase [Trueperella pyogenes]|uniref:peptidoglycan recognition protein family protein n=1 Tax=Trueperella pyogenes TaxID=1661 RepID=UPI00324800E7